MNYIFEILAGFVALCLAIYYYLTSTYDFWSCRGVKGPKPQFFYGNLKDVLLNKIFWSDYSIKVYKEFKKESMFGIFSLRTPILFITDPEHIKNVLIKDFSSFSDRGMKVYNKIDPLSQHLFSLEPKRWRPLRTKLSPVFTSGKLKKMFYLLMECGNHFEQFLSTLVAKNPEIECRDVTAKFMTDIIGVCAFGLKMNALAEEDSQFRKLGRKNFEVRGLRLLRLKIREYVPWLFKLLGPLMYDHEINDFFINTMTETIEYRKKNNIKRNDFVDLLMELREQHDQIDDVEMTDILLTAQAFVFFIAGFETSSTSVSTVLYELALNQEIQNKVREELLQTMKENNGELTYDGLKSMNYMNKVFHETLRKYPPVTIIKRKSMKEYTFPGTNVTIPVGTLVWIPAYAMQHDPDIYPDPETFDPERFEEEKIKQRHPSYYLPFGDGPRNCIGARFAEYQSRVVLSVILKNYKLDVCDRTCIPYVADPHALVLAPKGGIVLKFTKIN